jgi:hypothetical protein
MKHFEVEQWLDFVRGLAGPTDKKDMEQHLSLGCRKCSGMVRRLRRFAAAAAADAAYRIPDGAVRSACDILGQQRSDRVLSFPRLVAKLLFDNSRELALAGVRSQEQVMHQAMFEAGDYCVDLQLERERSPVILVGQIVNRTQPGQKVSGAPVILVSGGERVAGQTLSNHLGEFQIECQAAGLQRLCVAPRQAGICIEVPLKNFLQAGKKLLEF